MLVQPIDWTKPLEAIDSSGNVLPCKVTYLAMTSQESVVSLSNEYCTSRAMSYAHNGMPLHATWFPRIRNVQPPKPLVRQMSPEEMHAQCPLLYRTHLKNNAWVGAWHLLWSVKEVLGYSIDSGRTWLPATMSSLDGGKTWTPSPAEEKPCSCEPDIVMTYGGARYSIDTSGHPLRIKD
jgi:hypothetical protein